MLTFLQYYFFLSILATLSKAKQLAFSFASLHEKKMSLAMTQRRQRKQGS
jgi:hypothetical protein